MIIELGRVTIETRGPNLGKQYEPISVEPFCEATVPANRGSKTAAECPDL